MRGQWQNRRLGVGLAVLCALGLSGRALAWSAAEDAWQVVSVEGREFPPAFHVATDRLVLLSATHGTLQPVPFQIDERDRQGRLVLPDGPEASQDESPGVFDANDLLVFSAGVLGARVWVPDAVEIRVADPLTHDGGWVYLRRGTPPAMPAAVQYDPHTDTVRTSRYMLAFGRHTTTEFAFIGADGKPGRNLIDRVKARITLHLLGGLFAFHRNEQDIRNRVVAWKNGPVRLIRRTRIRVRVGLGLPQPEVTAETIFTADTFDAPATVSIPFDLRYVLGNLRLRTYMDFADLHGFRIFTRGHPPVPLGCGLPPTGLDGFASNWFGMTGPAGTFVQVLRMGAALASVRRLLYVVADPKPDPPERVPGDCPGVGYTLTHWGGIGRGTYRSDTIVRAFRTYSDDDIQEFVYSLYHPLTVTVSPLDP